MSISVSRAEYPIRSEKKMAKNSDNKGGITLAYESDIAGDNPNNTSINLDDLPIDSLHLHDDEQQKSINFLNYRTKSVFYINGQRISSSLCSKARPNQTLLDYLRNELKLTGSKLGCGEGGCGACTVLISSYNKEKGKIIHNTVNACLFPVLCADGCHITTIEGVGSWRKQYQGLICNEDAGGSCNKKGTEVKEDYLHPIQHAMVDMHGSQCGFCTPGIIMALYGLFSTAANDDTDEKRKGPKVSHLEEHLDGNLCRCTGYRPIWDAARSLCVDGSEDLEDCHGPKGPCGVSCRECPERDDCEMDCNVADKEGETEGVIVCSSTKSKVVEYQSVLQSKHNDKWWEQPNDMFPQELMLGKDGSDNEEIHKPLMVVDSSIHNGGTWFQPTTLEELLHLYQEFGNAEDGGIKMVIGNTEVGIETKFKHASYPRMIHPSTCIHSLYEIVKTESHIAIGACASLSTLQNVCHGLMSSSKNESVSRESRTATPIHDMLRWFASTQIRNVACLGGNLATASPISDMNPMLCALDATLVLASRPQRDGGIERRHVPVSDFFVGYRKVDMKKVEIIERIDVPLVQSKFEYVAPFKQARRREDDISIVTSGMRLKVVHSDDNWKIEDVSIAFGGMGPVTKLAKETMAFMVGKVFEEATFVEARQVLQKEFQMPDDVPGGQSQYRLILACSFLHKFYLYCVGELKKDIETKCSSTQLPPVPTILAEEECEVGFVSASKPSIVGTQKYPAPKVAVGLEKEHLGYNVNTSLAAKEASSAKKNDSVGKPATHASGELHCTGEAAYADDIPAPENLLHGSLILASQCHAKLTSIDTSPALQIPGVSGVFTHEDIKNLGGDSRMGPIMLDEQAFLPVGETVPFVGQPLGIVVGVSQEIAEKGARAVQTEYEELEGKAIVTIEEAIEANSFWESSIHQMHRGGDVTEILQQTSVDGKKMVVVEGEMRSGGQEHFYLEPNSTLAIPSESATNLTIYASTQAPTKTQDFVGRVTNTPAAKVVVRMKRMGGGFGGKETRSVFISVAAAIAAKLTNRPVRLTLNRDTDMMITGGRHSFLSKYKASAIINDDGSVKLHAMDVQLFNNGGSCFDLSGPILDRALFHVDNCYNWPHFQSKGTPCKTSQPPHTAFRGFGGPQGMVVTETIIDHLALACNVSGDKLRRDNMYTLEDATPFGMKFGEGYTGKWNVPKMWDRLYTELDVPGRRDNVAVFNKTNKWKKRGIGFIPTKFGIAFTAKFMNQGGALVHLYTDGTVLVSHGGTEMGQGLHTKVCQVVAQAFGIPLEHVHVNDSSTDKVANTIPSAASMSTDLYGMAALDACQQILKRIQPIRDSLPPDATLAEVAKAAFFERTNMTAHGFFALDEARCGYDWDKEKPDDYPENMPENTHKGQPFNYFTQGVALSEVEIDVLTGDHKVISTDVLVDVGSSINPAIDIGQIEGAFIQGMGWSTMEEVVYSDDDHKWIRPRGKTFTTGPGTYKIPAFNDVPEKMNVSLLDNADNPLAVHSSKAVGEPPFFLGTSVFFAIKDAVTAAREGKGYFEFRMPATSERIRMLCGDKISSECIAATGKESSSFQPKGSY